MDGMIDIMVCMERGVFGDDLFKITNQEQTKAPNDKQTPNVAYSCPFSLPPSQLKETNRIIATKIVSD